MRNVSEPELTAVLTGEEDEITVYQTRVKLFALNGDGGWRERGVGALKLNKKRDGSGGARMGLFCYWIN